MLTSGLPALALPEPPQEVTASSLRQAALPLMLTVPEPAVAVHMAGPQQGAWRPVSSLRWAMRPLMLTSGEPIEDGPTVEWGHAGQPWASESILTRSLTLNAAGMAS